MASGGAYHRAYLRANQQAFLEAHELAFAYFGGVFRVLQIRQSDQRRKEDPARPSARGDDAVHCLPLALGLRGGVL